MRELTITEMMQTSGGKPNDGYTFSFLVENTLTGFVLGWLFTGLNPAGGAVGAIFFGSYALCMMTAKSLDGFFFSEQGYISHTAG
jgi:hypothetical protein